MKALGLLTLFALVALYDCNVVRCPNPPDNWSVFCSNNASKPYEGYLYTIVFEMPVTFFMDRSVQYCVMVGNGAVTSPVATLTLSSPVANRVCLYRYEAVRLRQKSESIKLTFFDENFAWTGMEQAASLRTNGVVSGRDFPYAFLPYSPEFETRFLSNYTNTFYFQVTYYGRGSSIGEEIVDTSRDLPNLNFSPFQAGDYIYAILGTGAVIIVFSLFVYGFFIQPHYL
ncbi:hypothetical protein LOD99_15746 [Oopsacas minuta]|uniref:Uncharacterized protein n=1 Tax=Oopsacas minuta TaxID=111878 RepID=A0AAV7KA46_9METZ|nr:hypothetical protein LOD99_15746 [Oopsacas minuta]